MNVSYKSVDFYSKVFEWNPLLLLFLLISILATLLCPFFLYCIIWYERYGSDKRRTLLNRFTSLYCWATIQFFIIVQSTETARVIFGPLPPFICHLQHIGRFACADMFFLYKNCSIFTKYLFIIWLKNPAAFNEEFWAMFAWMWIQGYSFLAETSVFMLKTSQPVTFFICLGTERTIGQKNSFNQHLGINLFEHYLN